MKRLLCLWFPDWPIQRLIADLPEPREDLRWLTEKIRGRDLVRFCCEASRKIGVRPGMTLSDAQSLVRSQTVFLQPLDKAADRQGLKQLALWCERYSPCVGLEEADLPQCLLLDVTGVAALFSGERPLAEQILRELAEEPWSARPRSERRPWSVRLAIANTLGAAWAAAHFLAEAREPAILPPGDLEPVFSLPVEGLRLPPALVAKLHKLGLKTIGQVLRLEKSALKARFGNEILIRLEQLTGDRRELITPCRPLPVWEVRRDLEIGIAHFETVEQLSLALLRELLDLLQARHLGTSELCCRFHLEDRTLKDLIIRLREATADARHLEELVRLKLERLKLRSPVRGIHLWAETVAPLKWQELWLFAEESRQEARQLSVLLDRLSNRLGPEAVVYAVPASDPIPEHSLEFLPVSQNPEISSAGPLPPLLPLDRPLCLLVQPEPIEVLAVIPEGPPSAVFLNGSRKKIIQCWGPERIESGWWRGSSTRRDYYRIETQEGQRLWLFRRIPDQKWFLHGATF